MNTNARGFGCFVLACAILLFPLSATAQGTRGKDPAPPDNRVFEAALRRDLDAARTRLFQSARPLEAGPEIQRVFDSAIAYCIPGTDPTLIRDAGVLHRLMSQIAGMKPEGQADLLKIAADHPDLFRSVLLATSSDDSPAGVWAVLRLLIDQRGSRLAVRTDAKPGDKPPLPPELVAAFCIVYDQKGKDGAEAGIDRKRILEIFDFYADNWSQMALAREKFVPPPEVLALVVSPYPQVDASQLEWALKNYKGQSAVGKLYSTIVYDTGHFKFGRPKKIDSAQGGYTLQNIKKVGGVCVEQAHFACNVGKAIGIPAVTVSAAGSDVGHAWVGYMKSGGSGKWSWDFDEGRYKEYQDLRGNVLDPQSGKVLPDGYIGLTAGLMNAAAGREFAQVLFDASERLGAIEAGRVRYPPLPSTGTPASATSARPLGFDAQLALVETGLRACPAVRRGWEIIGGLAEGRKLSSAQLDQWANRVMELCADDHPDFAFATVSQMIRGVPLGPEQDKMWEWAIGRFNQRKDLAAAGWIGRGDMWQRARDNKQAYAAFHEVVERYPNQGQLIVDALRRCEQVLPTGGGPDALIDLYKDGWGRISKPKQMSNEFAAGSTYVTVGNRLADLLTGAGRAKEAEAIRKAVAQVIGKEKDK